jgi:L-threonylcarbamoyladenylate synthase
VISFPTDTVPALATLPDRATLLFATKQRSLDKPLILMGADANALLPYVTGTLAEQQQWQQVMQRYWPGALTLVLPASSQIPIPLNPKDPTSLGLRVPQHPVALDILQQVGPLATTSANRSGDPPLQTLAAIAATFPQVKVLQTAEMTRSHPTSGQPSTVARWTGEGWEILRQGAIPLSDLATCGEQDGE